LTKSDHKDISIGFALHLHERILKKNPSQNIKQHKRFQQPW